MCPGRGRVFQNTWDGAVCVKERGREAKRPKFSERVTHPSARTAARIKSRLELIFGTTSTVRPRRPNPSTIHPVH